MCREIAPVGDGVYLHVEILECRLHEVAGFVIKSARIGKDAPVRRFMQEVVTRKTPNGRVFPENGREFPEAHTSDRARLLSRSDPSKNAVTTTTTTTTTTKDQGFTTTSILSKKSPVLSQKNVIGDLDNMLCDKNWLAHMHNILNEDSSLSRRVIHQV